MTQCQKCQQQWKWHHVLKRTVKLTPAIICPYCQHEQYWHERTARINQKLLVISFSPALLGIVGFISAEEVFFTTIALGIVSILLSPFYYETSATPTRAAKSWLNK
ncbi:cxxc_20_cxxc protein [Halolactibacillus halophilus]|uniref:Cxxc_20_cxxc protein n=1 Tax=Halolactibacillus halophilus TaxID=306540 RepID=A0A1I5R6V0_9BACI|nr:TIGR04104 family putative zinc finger protein [Halolactibacillus halophilus]SFP54120.1 cxxc_20_cxxc protein [Halolactibacillus halophilus]